MLHMTDTHRRHIVGRILLGVCGLWILLGLSLQAGWANSAENITLLGLVKSRPDSVTGYGIWTVEKDQTGGGGTIYTVVIDHNTELTPSMPTVGDRVQVFGVLQDSTTVIASKVERKSDNAAASDKLYGWVKTAPAKGLGEWVLRLRQDTTQVVLADSNTRFPHGIPREGAAVEIRYVLQNGNTYLAKSIRPDDYEAQQVIVRLRSGVTPAIIANRYGLLHLATLLVSGNIHLFQTPEYTENDFVNRLSADPDIVWAELNYVGHIPIGNPKRVWNWGGTDPTGYVNQHAFDQVNSVPALAHYRGEGVVVAVIDTGADLNHEALRDHFVAVQEMWDVVGDDQIPQDEGPGNAQGHGTHIAGIVAHLAPASKLMIVRALDQHGRGNTVKVAYAIGWAVDHGANVINLSLGSDFDSRILNLAVTSALEKGIVVVAAAGNSNTSSRQYPAGYADVLSVTAVDAANFKADFANYGASWVKIAAPGVGITSSIIGPQGSGYASWSGTSMSTAFVSGAAALLRQKDPTAPGQEIANRLRNHARDLNGTNPTYAGELGGLLDVGAALELETAATATPTPLLTESPTPVPPLATATPVTSTADPTPSATTTPPPTATPMSSSTAQHVYLSVVKK